MRLNPEEIAAIKRLIAEAYGPEAVVRLFGSRVDDRRRGGDVDLYVETDATGPYTADDLHALFRLKDRLERALDERKVDLLVKRRDREPRPIERIARRTGIVL